MEYYDFIKKECIFDIGNNIRFKEPIEIVNTSTVAALLNISNGEFPLYKIDSVKEHEISLPSLIPEIKKITIQANKISKWISLSEDNKVTWAWFAKFGEIQGTDEDDLINWENSLTDDSILWEYIAKADCGLAELGIVGKRTQSSLIQHILYRLKKDRIIPTIKSTVERINPKFLDDLIFNKLLPHPKIFCETKDMIEAIYKDVKLILSVEGVQVIQGNQKPTKDLNILPHNLRNFLGIYPRILRAIIDGDVMIISADSGFLDCFNTIEDVRTIIHSLRNHMNKSREYTQLVVDYQTFPAKFNSGELQKILLFQ